MVGSLRRPMWLGLRSPTIWHAVRACAARLARRVDPGVPAYAASPEGAGVYLLAFPGRASEGAFTWATAMAPASAAGSCNIKSIGEPCSVTRNRTGIS